MNFVPLSCYTEFVVNFSISKSQSLVAFNTLSLELSTLSEFNKQNFICLNSFHLLMPVRSFFFKCPTVGTCCRGGFRRAFLSGRTRNCETGIRSWRTTEPALQYVPCYASIFILLSNSLILDI